MSLNECQSSALSLSTQLFPAEYKVLQLPDIFLSSRGQKLGRLIWSHLTTCDFFVHHFSVLSLICHPVCMHVYITFIFQCSSSESSLSHLSLNWPLKWESLGQDRSCQHLGALGKDANMGCRGQRMSAPHHYSCWKKVGFSRMLMSLRFHFTPEIQRENDYWIIHKLFNISIQMNQTSSGNIQWKRMKRIFGSKIRYVLKIVGIDTVVNTMRLTQSMPLKTFSTVHDTKKDMFCFFYFSF